LSGEDTEYSKRKISDVLNLYTSVSGRVKNADSFMDLEMANHIKLFKINQVDTLV
jgi:hypothetical protein